MNISTPFPVNTFLRGYNSDDVPARVNDIEQRFDYKFMPWQQWDRWINHPAFASRPMRLGPGEWHVADTLVIDTPGVTVIGDPASSIMKSTSSSDILTISADNVAIIGVQFVLDEPPISGAALNITGNDVIISNCFFNGRGVSKVINTNISDRLKIEHCYILGGTGDIIYVLDSDDVMIMNNRIINDRGGEAINLASTVKGAVATRCNHALVSGNHIGPTRISYNDNGSNNVGDPAVTNHAMLNNHAATFNAY